jgi:hypothetical protein
VDPLKEFLDQVRAVGDVWMPFVLALAALAFMMWKAFEWRYRGIIEQLREDRDYWKGMAARSVGVDADVVKQKRLAAKEERVAAATKKAPEAPRPQSTMPSYSEMALEKYGEDVLLPDSVTPAFLFGLCEGKTDIQCEGAVAIYMGKRLKVSGRLFAASRVGSSTTVSIYPDKMDHAHTIYMIFEADHAPISVMREGDKVNATGRITELYSSGMKLADCRLV